MVDQKIRVDSGSPERVALEIALQVAGWESARTQDVYTRAGFLDLYAECLRAAHGRR